MVKITILESGDQSRLDWVPSVAQNRNFGDCWCQIPTQSVTVLDGWLAVFLYIISLRTASSHLASDLRETQNRDVERFRAAAVPTPPHVYRVTAGVSATAAVIATSYHFVLFLHTFLDSRHSLLRFCA